ncbi:MAG: hypothetical protein ACLQVI_26135 [Polyangiaceae bacterium]
MSWSKLDDRYAFHRKVLAAGNEAVGAHARMISYASGEGTDGLVTASTAMLIAGSQAVIDKLVSVVLLERLESGDYQIHDFGDYNPPADEVRAKREADRQRKELARSRQGRATNGRVTSGRPAAVPSDVRTDSQRTSSGRPTVPDPDPDPDPVPDPIQRERESCAGARTEHEWGDFGEAPEPETSEHAEVRAAYFEGYERIAGVKPTWEGREGAAAKRLITKYPGEAVTIVRNAYADPFWAKTRPLLHELFAKADKFRGNGVGRNRILQPDGGSWRTREAFPAERKRVDAPAQLRRVK